MAQIAALTLIFSLISLTYITKAQDRAPHGISNESPMAFSPAAFEFFHPKSENPSGQDLCTKSSCSPLPVAAIVASTLGQGSRSSEDSRIGARGLVAIGFAFAFVVFSSAIGLYYVVVKRRANLSRANSVKPCA